MDNLAKDLREAYSAAQEIAAKNGKTEVLIEHLLSPLVDCKGAKELLAACKIEADTVKSRVEEYLSEISEDPKDIAPEELDPSAIVNRVFKRAAVWLQSCGKPLIIEAENVVSGIMAEKGACWACELLANLGLKRHDVVNWINHGQQKGDITPRELAPAGQTGSDTSVRQDDGSPLAKFGRNLIDDAANGKIDPLIGREQEVQRAIQVLSRRRKNNPVFVGESGVGKSALVEGLALKIQSGEVPEKIRDRQIYSLAMSDLVAGCRYRGDFEERMKSIVEEVRNRPEVIVFIDEIHTMVNAGTGGSGSLDAANILKPALERGEFRCIGATTYAEFRKHFTKDAALARRFQEVEVDEPTEGEALSIIQGLRPKFEEHHGVSISDEVISGAIELSQRYLASRKLPDKVVDIIDEVGAIYSAGVRGQFGEDERPEVTLADVEEVVSFMSKVPVASPKEGEAASLKFLEGNLKASIFGQDSAISAAVKAIKVAKAGLKDEGKPLASLMLVGPTGVGKTELTTQLGRELDLDVLRFDMSEYQEKHSVSRLIGAPPGYVGHGEGGLLTEGVSKKPHCILLLDEIEKAHPDIYNTFLQVMDHGVLTDSQGRPVNFKNVILIMTSNAGAADMAKPGIGFLPSEKGSKENKVLNDTFSPEFRNRLDAVVSFSALEPEHMSMIVEKEILLLEKRLEKKDVLIELDAEARTWLAKKGYDRAMGARPLKRVVRVHVQEPLAEEILHGELIDGGVCHISVSGAGGELSYRYEARTKQIEDLSQVPAE